MKPSPSKSKIVAVVLLAGLVPALVSEIGLVVFGVVAHKNEPLHECLELAGAFIALTLALLLWFRAEHEKESDHLLWIAVGLVAMGLMDGAHAVAPFGLAWSWLRHGATLVGGLLFALVWLPLPAFALRRRRLLMVGVAALSMASALSVWWRPDLLPAPFAAGGYTFAVLAANGLGGMGFLAAAIFFLRRYLRQSERENLVFASLTFLFAIAGLLFGLSHVWTADWWVWHGFRLLAYGILLMTAYNVFQVGEQHRRQLTEAVQRERQRLHEQQFYSRSLLEASLDPLVTISREGKITDVNRATETATGVAREQLIGSDFCDYFTEPEKARAGYEQVFADGFVQEYALAVRHTSGRLIDVLYNATVFRNQNGEVEGVFAAARDVTARKRAQEKLQHLAAIIENSDDAIYGKDLEGTILSWNRGAEKMYGYTAEEMIGQSVSRLVPPEHRDDLPQILERIRRGENVDQYETLRMRKDGTRCDAAITVSAMRDAQGRIVGASTTARDITERKRAEGEIRKQAALLELAPAGILVRDMNGRIVFWSRGAEELYGWTKEQVLGRITHELLRTRFPEPVEEIESTVLAGTRWEGELRHVVRSGEEITVASRWAVQRDNNGQPTGFLEINVDITARKQAEQELQRYAAELERSNAELQDFASIASHDLQEPLRKVLAFGEHLREHLGSNLDELGSDFLGRMQNAAQRMSALIQALLEYSRVATRAQPFAPVDMTQLLFAVLVDMEDRIAKTRAGVEFMPLPKVMADATQVRQLLQNLLGNALKFQRPGARPHLLINGTRKNGWCEITVTDNGIGFDEKYLDRIFRPFQRLHGRGEYEGSGMGLAICRKVVARHGGTITAHSRTGEGSTFVVTLPTAAMTEGRGTTWQMEPEASSFESSSPRTMTTTSS